MGTSIQPKYVVGYRYVNKQGLDVEVIEYRGRKDITVQFLLDGARKTTTGSYIKGGLPLHPSYGKYYVGQQFPCHDGDTVEITALDSQTHAEVKWLSDGTVSKRATFDLSKGHNRHPTKNKPKVGDTFATAASGVVKVVKFNSATDVIVEFEDGATRSVQMGNLKTGNVRHPSCNLTIGSEYITNSGWKLTVEEYIDTNNVRVKWQDGSESWEDAGDIRLGTIKPLMQPSVEGRGYFGHGRFVTGRAKSGEKVDDRVYGFWIRMFKRCYNPNELNKSRNAQYRDVHIDPHWHNFQNFAEWAYKQPYVFGDNAELDKDLLKYGSKMYSPESCSIVPREVNSFLMDQGRGEYYRGVNVVRPKTPNAAIGYIARACTDKGREYLGFYPTPEEAFHAYKARKESYARELAAKWKDKIDVRAYNALMAYTVEITD